MDAYRGTHRGFEIVVTAEDDDASNSMREPDGDGYTAKQVKAYQAGEWHYVVLAARAYLEGVELGTAYLGGVEAGWYVMTDENDNVTGEELIDPLAKVEEWYSDLLEEVAEEAAKKLTALQAHEIKD